MLLLVAWLVYRPELSRPFDYIDFPEDLLVLQRHPGLFQGYQALSQVYTDHGRWKPVMNALLAGQWTWFGTSTSAWYATRFAVMAAAVLVAHSLFRKLQLSPFAAAVATALLVVSPAAAMGWTRLSTPEPIALLLLAVGCHVAIARPSRRKAWVLAALMVGVVWTKEVTIAACVFPLSLMLLSHDDGLLRTKFNDRRRLGMLTFSAAALVLGSIPVLWIWNTAPADSFASRYASSGVSVMDVAGGTIAALFPFAPVPDPSPATLGVMVAAMLCVLFAAILVTIREEALRTHRRVLLGLGLGVPVLGALVYSPWPFYLLVYALPFMLGGALVTGLSIDASMPVRGTRVVVMSSIALVLTFGLMQSANDAARTRALHTAFARTVTAIADREDVDTVLVEVAAGQFDDRGNFGPRFVTFAWMLGLQWPAVRDVPCNATPSDAPRVLRLRLNLMCPGATLPAIVERYPRFRWPDPRPRQDSITVGLYGT